MGNRQMVAWEECLGRDGWDPPEDVPPDMGTEALNVSLYEGRLGQKRPGAPAVTLTGDSFSGYNALGRFVAAQDESAAELFIVSQDGTPKILRVTSGTTAVNLTLTDNITALPQDAVFAFLNGKMFMAYKSGINRLHVYAPGESTSVVRRVGLALPGVPTVANAGGAGAYAAIIRYYCVAYRVKSGGGAILRQSNMGPVATFTPDGSHLEAQITKPATISEGETHWVVYGSAQSAAGPFYELAEIVVGTTTYNDTAAPSSYSTNPLSPLIGAFFPFLSTKAIMSDGARLFGLGVYESSAGDSVDPLPGTLYWTPTLRTSEIGSTIGVGDDERIQHTIDQDDFLYLSINGPGGVDAGMSQSQNGVFFCFQTKGIYQILATGQATAPFKRLVISQSKGNIRHQTIVNAEDETGAPAVYFLDPLDGPRRLGLGGTMQWLGKDITDIWATVNLSATTVVGWGLYDSAAKQVKWWVSTGSNNEPDTMIVYHVAIGQVDVRGDIRKGWAKWTGGLSANRCGVMFASTLASTRPLTLVPYAGNSSGLMRQDGTSNQDAGVSYQGYVQQRAEAWGIFARRKRATEAYVIAKAQSATSISVKTIKNWSAETITENSVSIAPAGSETRVRVRIDDLDNTDLIVSQAQIGDAAAANVTWTLDGYIQLVEVLDGAI